MPPEESLVPVGKIEQRILLIRGEKITIDADLAQFNGVPTKRLNEQVKRNKAHSAEAKDGAAEWAATTLNGLPPSPRRRLRFGRGWTRSRAMVLNA